MLFSVKICGYGRRRPVSDKTQTETLVNPSPPSPASSATTFDLSPIAVAVPASDDEPAIAKLATAIDRLTDRLADLEAKISLCHDAETIRNRIKEDGLYCIYSHASGFKKKTTRTKKVLVALRA